jgi:hypothetical protein
MPPHLRVLRDWVFVVSGGYKARACMDIDLAKSPCTGIDKLVRGAGCGNHDLAGSGFNRFVTNGEGGLSCLHDKDFFVGMALDTSS